MPINLDEAIGAESASDSGEEYTESETDSDSENELEMYYDY